MLKALRTNYRVCFLTFSDRQKRAKYESDLQQLCDEAIVLPSRYNANLLSRVVFKSLGELYARFTGLKVSNFAIGSVELTSSRVRKAIKGMAFEAVIFEYWHAHKLIDKDLFGSAALVLDMHNILWQTYKSQKIESGNRSDSAFDKYKKYEEKVWKKFNYLIAINRDEASYVKSQLGGERVWYIPMGINLDNWPVTTDPNNSEPRLAYYGGLASAHNQRDAMRVYKEVMPEVWNKFPKAQLWIIGSKPPQHISQLQEKDSRVTVTGFLDDVAPTIGSMDLILCPWEGTYGFRSRLVEVMATGSPVITTEDAAKGMDFENGQGILYNNNIAEWPDMTIHLLSSPQELLKLRKLSRKSVEVRYSLEATYNHLPQMISSVNQ
ncbi:MAG: glycosyltransferase [Roseivirga sp.]|nr:glycosyltransferase [Roseivirga sp.]